MRRFNDGDTITVEPWRSAGFPVIKDLMVDGLPCGSKFNWLTFAETNNMAEPFLQAATQAPQPNGPATGATTCQIYMRRFNDGDTITVEPWRSAGFPVIKDVDVKRTHTADTFAAVVVEYNRFFSFADQLFVQKIYHLH